MGINSVVTELILHTPVTGSSLSSDVLDGKNPTDFQSSKRLSNSVVFLISHVFQIYRRYRMLKRMMKIALGSEVDKSYVVEEKPIATGGPHFCWRVLWICVCGNA